ncbi:MAG: hypothetical protein RLY97_2157 [Pseudomonadota bacterium]|jgi:putative membrane protein
MAHKFTLTKADRVRIGTAVTAAEAQTSGEIVTIITDQSDSYGDWALIWSAVVALMALVALSIAPEFYIAQIDRVMGWWSAEWPPRALFTLAAIVATIKFVGMRLILLWQPLLLWLTPKPVKQARVRLRALTCFRVGTEKRTTGSTGVLIYLSRAERRAEIVTESSISAKISPEVWGAAMAALLSHIKQGHVADGMIDAIAQVGVVLAEHFPRDADDVNELPDRLIEV